MNAGEREQGLWIRVRPRASRAGFAVAEDGELVARVHGPAVGGQANRELVGMVAEAVGAARSAVRIGRGEKSRRKQIGVEGMSTSELRERLAARAAGKAGR